MWWSFQTIKLSKKEYTFIALGAITAILFCILSVWKGDILFFFIPVMLLVAFAFLVILFREPLTGLITTMVYCFLMGIPAREIGGLAYGIGIELFLLLT